MAGPRYKQFAQPDAGSSFVRVGDAAGGSPGDISGGDAGNEFRYNATTDLLTLTGSVTIGGDLIVQGTTTSVDTQLQTADRYILLNSEYTADLALDAGLILNVDPAATSFGISDITANVISVTAGDPSAVLGVGDFILIQNPATAANAGVYEVLSTTASSITIDTTPAEDWSGTGLTNDATVQGTVVGIVLSALRADSTGVFQPSYGSSAPMTFGLSIDGVNRSILGNGGDVTIGSASNGLTAPGWLNVGTPSTLANAVGEFSTGTATRSLIFDPAATRSALLASTANAQHSLAVQTASGTASNAALTCLIDGSTNGADSFSFQAFSTAFTPAGRSTPESGMISTGSNMGGGITIWAFGGDSVRLATGVTATQHWEVNSAGNWITGQAGLDIGSTTDAEQPRDVHINRALNVGDVTASTSEGDIVASNGTNELFWNTTTPLLTVGGEMTVSSSLDGNHDLLHKNSSTNALAVTVFRVNNHADEGGFLAAYSATHATNAGSFILAATNQTLRILTGTDLPIIFETNNADSWSILNSTDGGHFVAIGARDIGTTTDADQPRDLHLNRALNVGDVTASASEGDIVAGDGANSLQWDASAASVTITGSGNNSVSLDADSGSAVTTVRDIAGNLLHTGLSINAYNSSGVGGVGLGGQIIFSAENDGSVTSSALEQQGYMRMFWRDASESSGAPFQAPYAQWELWMKRGVVSGAGGEKLALVLGNTTTATGDMRAEFWSNAGDRTVTINADQESIQIGQNASAPGAAGDIVAGDGTNELHYSGADGSLNLGIANGASQTFDTATAVVDFSVSDTATGLIPAGAMVVGVTTYVFGTAISGGGATGYEVGDGTDVDRWGSIVGLAIGTSSDPRDFTDNTLSFNTGLSAADVVLTGLTGTPTAGTVRVVVTYMSLTAPTS